MTSMAPMKEAYFPPAHHHNLAHKTEMLDEMYNDAENDNDFLTTLLTTPTPFTQDANRLPGNVDCVKGQWPTSSAVHTHHSTGSFHSTSTSCTGSMNVDNHKNNNTNGFGSMTARNQSDISESIQTPVTSFHGHEHRFDSQGLTSYGMNYPDYLNRSQSMDYVLPTQRQQSNALRMLDRFDHGYTPMHSSLGSMHSYPSQRQHVQTPVFSNASTTSRSVPKRKRGRRSNNASADTRIDWDSLSLDDEVASMVLSVIPRDIIDDYLNNGSSVLQQYNINLDELSEDQQQALKTVKFKARAEKKSRREKQRRVHVNDSLMKLAAKINLPGNGQGTDTNTILIQASLYIDSLHEELRELKKAKTSKVSKN